MKIENLFPTGRRFQLRFPTTEETLEWEQVDGKADWKNPGVENLKFESSKWNFKEWIWKVRAELRSNLDRYFPTYIEIL